MQALARLDAPHSGAAWAIFFLDESCIQRLVGGGLVTIALALKVLDGLVLGTDSASTVTAVGSNGQVQVVNVFNHANKIVNLHRGLPVALMTWGLGNIGSHSISEHAKTLRSWFEDGSGPQRRFRQREKTFTVQGAADLVADYFGEALSALPGPAGGQFVLGLCVAGYDAGSRAPTVYTMVFDSSLIATPVEELQAESGAVYFGQPEALLRLVTGFGDWTESALVNLGVDPTLAPQYVQELRRQTHVDIVNKFLPIQDAVGLAEFLVDTTIKFTRYCPGSDTVGGPIELAAVTRYEGFKWVKRKHFYPPELNEGRYNVDVVEPQRNGLPLPRGRSSSQY